MNELLIPYGLSLAVVATLMLTLWIASLARRDASIVDPFWGPGFALVALVALLSTDGYGPRRWLLFGLVAIWALRLGAYLAWRNRGKGEDFRYAAMRSRHGDRFRWVSAFTVFGLQGGLMWLLSIPLQLVLDADAPARLTWLDALGTALWVVGFLFEAVGDWQLARFKADPDNRGRVMDRGLWRYTRHPNYFGEAVLWWGYGAIAASVPGGEWTLLSPALMTFLLLKVSGVGLLEDTLEERPAYREYMERTSAFLPLPPGSPNDGDG